MHFIKFVTTLLIQFDAIIEQCFGTLYIVKSADF